MTGSERRRSLQTKKRLGYGRPREEEEGKQKPGERAAAERENRSGRVGYIGNKQQSSAKSVANEKPRLDREGLIVSVKSKTVPISIYGARVYVGVCGN